MRDVLRDKVVVGSPEYVAERLRQLQEELGIDGILAELNFGGTLPSGADDAVAAAAVRGSTAAAGVTSTAGHWR